jgi:hypothetical protein
MERQIWYGRARVIFLNHSWMMEKHMENKDAPRENRPKRSIVDRIVNPTPNDEVAVRIFLWASILSYLILPRIFQGLEHSPAWKAFSVTWLVVAVFLRFKIFFRR